MTAVDPTAPVRRRVVIAEDEALIRMDLAEMLGEEGYDVVGQAGDGARAVELAEELRPDLVILDVKMPVLDGIAAAERIAAAAASRRSSSSPPSPSATSSSGPGTRAPWPTWSSRSPSSDLVPAIEMAVSRFAELTALEREVADLTDRLETRKAVDRAKAVLQSEPGPQRARGVPLDPEDRDGPAALMRQVAEGVITHGPGLAG